MKQAIFFLLCTGCANHVAARQICYGNADTAFHVRADRCHDDECIELERQALEKDYAECP